MGILVSLKKNIYDQTRKKNIYDQTWKNNFMNYIKVKKTPTQACGSESSFLYIYRHTHIDMC